MQVLGPVVEAEVEIAPLRRDFSRER